MYTVVSILSNNYSKNLRIIKNPPKCLYAIGNINLLNEDSIAVVGSRTITEYGIKYCKKICKEIALRNIPIISGMAVGTDTIAHETALEYGNKTIAVLPSGFNNIFPEENKELFHRIIENGGLVISEYSPEIKASSEKFLKRNRIVSGLSKGLLVIEATYRSGTSVTAKIAKEQGKKVFAVPGSLDNSHSYGTNMLIKHGAILVMEAVDIFNEFEEFKNRKPRIKSTEKIKKEYKNIYNFILENKIVSTEEIIEKFEMPEREVVRVLGLMELEDLILQEFGVGYKVKE